MAHTQNLDILQVGSLIYPSCTNSFLYFSDFRAFSCLSYDGVYVSCYRIGSPLASARTTHSRSGRTYEAFTHVCSASLRCACAALVHLVRARSLSFGITLAKCAWVVPSFRSVLACAMSTCSSRSLLRFAGLQPACSLVASH